jgi:hypothetical protein
MRKFAVVFPVIVSCILPFSVLALSPSFAPAQTAEAEPAGTVVLEANVAGTGSVNKRFMISLPIVNQGTASAKDVSITSVSLGSAAVISPASFPVSLGTIAANVTVIFQVDFNNKTLVSGTPYTYTVNGTYQLNGKTTNFTFTPTVRTLPASPGSASAHQVNVSANSPAGPYPPQSPVFGPTVNEPAPPVPVSPAVPRKTTSGSTSVGQAQGQTRGAAPPSSVVFNWNDQVGLPAGDVFGIAEPSGASGNGLIFVSFNWGVAYSSDGGSTFTELNPTTIFPNDSVQFCCDQWVQYVPSIDRFIWLLQGASVENGGVGGYRLASASPGDIELFPYTAWTYWDLTPTLFDEPAQTDYDYPGMSVGTNSLYVNWDAGAGDCGGPPNNNTCNSGREVIRIPLSQIQAASTISIDYTSPSDSSLAWAAAVTQDTGSEVFWAGHNGTTLLRIFSWAEGSNSYSWRDVQIDSYTPNQDGCTNSMTGAIVTCSPPLVPHVASLTPTPVVTPPTPQTTDWIFRDGDDAITGATRSGDNIWFAWASAPEKTTLVQPYIVLVSIDTNTYAKAQQMEIWNPAFGFILPSIATNACTGEIGVSLATGGGGTYYPNGAVGFWGDYIVYQTTNSNVTEGEYGDYVTLRQNNTQDNDGAFFDAFGIGLTKLPGAGSGPILPPSQVDVGIQYSVFGRGGACTGGAQLTGGAAKIVSGAAKKAARHGA